MIKQVDTTYEDELIGLCKRRLIDTDKYISLCGHVDLISMAKKTRFLNEKIIEYTEIIKAEKKLCHA